MKHQYRNLLALILVILLGGGLLLSPPPLWANGATPPGESVQPKKQAPKNVKKQSAVKKKQPVVNAKKPANDQKQKNEAAAIARAQAELRARTAWKQGQHLVETGDYRSAISFLQRYIRDHAPSADAWYWLSRAHHALGDYDRSQDAANIALQLDPLYPALTKAPSGLQPLPIKTKATRGDPPPSMAVLPIKPVLPTGIQLTPVTISPPYFNISGDKRLSGDIPAEGRGVPGLIYKPYPPLPRGKTPAWMQKERFQEISRWRHRVDRIGILEKPRVPIAWRGDRPSVIFLWTGKEWARINGRRVLIRGNILGRSTTEKASSSLRRTREEIEQFLTEKGFVWHEADTPALASQTAHWRYAWADTVRLGATPTELPPTKASSDDATVIRTEEKTGEDAADTRIYREEIQWLPPEPEISIAPTDPSAELDQNGIPGNQIIFEDVD